MKIDIDVAGKATKFSNLTALPSFLHAHHPYMFLSYISVLIKSYPCNYLSRECVLYKASNLQLGDHVCEMADVVK